MSFVFFWYSHGCFLTFFLSKSSSLIVYDWFFLEYREFFALYEALIFEEKNNNIRAMSLNHVKSCCHQYVNFVILRPSIEVIIELFWFHDIVNSMFKILVSVINKTVNGKVNASKCCIRLRFGIIYNNTDIYIYNIDNHDQLTKNNMKVEKLENMTKYRI